MSSGCDNKPPGSFSITPTRPSELFRADLISAMKVPDSHSLEPNSYIEIKESWRTEWELGVQVCANELPKISFKDNIRSIGEASNSVVGASPTANRQLERHPEFKMPSHYMKGDGPSSDEDGASRKSYELDELDLAWLDCVTNTTKFRVLTGSQDLSEETLQKAMTTLERKCYKNMLQAIKTDEALRIEFDESVVCDICRDTEREENNEMVFCDSCNVCVHQACYGVLLIPEGSWVCRPCGSHNHSPPCALCTNRTGAMKKVKPSPGWAHVSCALWVPEVKFGNVDRMEPITNIDAIPASRWNLICSVCKKREGACVQCSYPTCVSAYHVTCGFRDGLEMRTKLTSNGVLHESYCSKHTTLRKTPTKNSSMPDNTDNKSTRDTRSSQLEYLLDRFHEYATPPELSRSVDISPILAGLICNYWILKRKSCFNRPLVPELLIDFTSQRLPTGVEYDKSIPEDEDFLSIVHARQNLEKARNLMYMVQRRERVKRQMIITSEETTKLELQLLEEEDKRGPKQPLCLKRLGNSFAENGDDFLSSGSESENGRVLRKKNLRTLSNSDEYDLGVGSPKRLRPLINDKSSINGGISSNGQ